MSNAGNFERRLKELEDRAEISHLLSTHPLSADSGDTRFWAEHWTADAQQEKLRSPQDPSPSRYGRSDVIAEIQDPKLEALRQSGIMHFPSPPHILISGDAAVATTYAQLVVLEDGKLRILNLTASRWELARVSGKWKVKLRVMRNIGSDGSVKLLKSGLVDFN